MKTKISLLLSILIASVSMIQVFANNSKLDALIKARRAGLEAVAASKKRAQEARIADKVAEVAHEKALKASAKTAKVVAQKAENANKVFQRLKHAKIEVASPYTGQLHKPDSTHPHEQSAVKVRLKALKLQNRENSKALQKAKEATVALHKLVQDAKMHMTLIQAEEVLHTVTKAEVQKTAVLKKVQEGTTKLQILVRNAKAKMMQQ